MTVKNVWTGSMGPFQYDDAGAFKDGTPYRALRTDGSISTSALKIFGGSPAAGKVWTATNAAGDGSWQDPAASSGGLPTNQIWAVVTKTSITAGSAVNLFRIATPLGDSGTYILDTFLTLTKANASEACAFQVRKRYVVVNIVGGTKPLNPRTSGNVIQQITAPAASGTNLVFVNAPSFGPAAGPANNEETFTVSYSNSGTDTTTLATAYVDILIYWQGYSSAPTITAL